MIENNFKINRLNLNETVNLYGWINKIRKMGDIIFLDLRGSNGIVQIVLEKNHLDYEKVLNFKNNDIISISGKVFERKNKNKNIFSGDIEIIANKINLISAVSNQLPILPFEEITALEQVRMRYRYLDLRRPNIFNIFKIRSEFNKYTRRFFDENNFLEIETPYLTKRTYGGASELIVTSKNHLGKEYALAQSPQIYKQLLMYSGFERYYQIARCFRDEDSRSDRQLEFTQLDLEMSFINDKEIEEKIYLLIELYFEFILKNVFKKEILLPFKRITYKYALENYGSDKPDLRYENKIFDLIKNNLIKLKDKKIAKGIAFEKNISISQIKKIKKDFKDNSINFSYFFVKDGIYSEGEIKEEFKKDINKFNNFLNLSNYFVIFLISEDKNKLLNTLGEIRIKVAKKLNLANKDKLKFCWITDFPLFDKDKENNLVSSHNPFVALKDESDLEKINLKKENELLNLMSRSYDLVLNGYEIAGGSIRIRDKEIQRKIFKILKLTNEEIDRNFDWLLTAQSFATPYHGGIALGIDRILAILLKKSSIKEVIAFPKTSQGTDELSGAPSEKN
ncbi:MAG: aspartate--tRNA ligase [Candidatus Hepatoplasma vulgare]|nr:MAG: aspartate--tRNA ligase [Candidatus Hepatoplasma sp.]